MNIIDDISSIERRIGDLYEKISELEAEVLLGRYIISAFIGFYLEREPVELRKLVLNTILGEARATAEIGNYILELTRGT